MEIRAPFGASRGAHFVVVNAGWARRYLRPETPLAAGHIYSKLQQADFGNTDARDYFAGLLKGSAGYRLAYTARYDGLWPAVHVHDSLDETIWIFERQVFRHQP
jgi:hypothetical protein